MGAQESSPPRPHRLRRRGRRRPALGAAPGAGHRSAAVRARVRPHACAARGRVAARRPGEPARAAVARARLSVHRRADARAPRGPGPGFLPLAILPAMWLALYGSRRQLLIELGRDRRRGAAAVGADRRREVPASTPRSALLVLAVAAIAGLSIQRLLGEVRATRDRLVRRPECRDRERDHRDRSAGDDHRLQPGRGAHARLSRRGGRRRATPALFLVGEELAARQSRSASSRRSRPSWPTWSPRARRRAS